MKKTHLTIFFLAIFISLNAQSNLEHALSGGIKRNFFNSSYRTVATYNQTSADAESANSPKVDNTNSFFIVLRNTKQISKRFLLVNNVGLDFLQLNIVKGSKYQASAGGINFYQKESLDLLIPRLKMDFGFDFVALHLKKNRLLVGASLGGMISLSSNGPSYTLYGTKVAFDTPKLQLFTSYSTSTYGVQIPHFSEYYGNWSGQTFGNERFLLNELAIGAAIKL